MCVIEMMFNTRSAWRSRDASREEEEEEGGRRIAMKKGGFRFLIAASKE